MEKVLELRADSAFQKSVSILCLKLTNSLMNSVELGCDMPAFGQSRGKEECQNKKRSQIPKENWHLLLC